MYFVRVPKTSLLRLCKIIGSNLAKIILNFYLFLQGLIQSRSSSPLLGWEITPSFPLLMTALSASGQLPINFINAGGRL